MTGLVERVNEVLDRNKIARAKDWFDGARTPAEWRFAHWLRKVRAFQVDMMADYNDAASGVRGEVPLERADVVSSALKGSGQAYSEGHHVVLDIDYPAHLIPSSTEGHFHLILEVPGGVPHVDYMVLLKTLAEFNIIEPGYAAASIDRGHSDIRVPWVRK